MSKKDKNNTDVVKEKKHLDSYVSKRVNSLYKKAKRRKVIFTVILSLFLVNVLMYVGIILTGDQDDPVQISIDNQDIVGLTLSDNNFQSQSAYLGAPTPKKMTNITYASIPTVNINNTYGSHNGENYIAYTFELKNNTEMKYDVEEKLIITAANRGIEKAIRVMVYTNDVAQIYANPITGTDDPEPVSESYKRYSTPFVDSYTVLKNTIYDFSPNEIRKYTIVIWIEGSDPDCTDELVGGEFRVAFNFTIKGDK